MHSCVYNVAVQKLTTLLFAFAMEILMTVDPGLTAKHLGALPSHTAFVMQFTFNCRRSCGISSNVCSYSTVYTTFHAVYVLVHFREYFKAV